ncbi:MAG: BspA family leucine-rich repeat surface protein [Prevotella sp.]|nr:BspA family leucine-rich repeat surface protein [Prevotella sp.]
MKKFIFTIIALFGILMPTSAAEGDGSTYREAYAVLELTTSEEYEITDAWITLYYDDLKSTRKGTVVDIDKMMESPEIMQTRRVLHSVIIDPSFADARPTSTQYWFANCFELKTISGLEYLNTSEVTDMSAMFMECGELTELDLSHFDTSKVTSMNNMFFRFAGTTLDLSSFDTSNVTDMAYMFANCSSLTTIYVSDKWVTTNVTEGDYMFGDCTALVGGNGTTFDENHTDPSYARIDKQGQPGYFTDGGSTGKDEEQITATPTWAFQNNMLILSCKTEGAEINYAMENWTTEEEADSISKAMDVIAKSVVYKDPIEVTDNIVIKMYALKEGLRTSKDTTFIYDYKSWSELYDVIRYGVEIAEKAQASGKVEEGLIEELKWALNEGDHMYQMRAEVSNSEAKYFTEAIMEACKKIEAQMNATSGKVATPTFSFNGDSLVISTTTEDALIWYQSAAIDSTFEESFAQYSGPIVIGDVKMNAKATKEGMEDSEVASMVYYYTEWQELIETTYICDKVLSEILQSKPSENITKMIDDVYVELAYVRAEYEGHRLEWDRDKIEDEIMKLKHVVAEIEEEWKKESSEATYENLTLTVGGTNTMATALEMVGGRDEVTKDIAAIVWNSTEPLTKSDLEGFDNPNMLIFVNEASMAPEGVENVVVDGKAKSIVLIDTDSINNNFYAPQEFTAESISYTREFKQTTQKDVSRGWEGICLPFTVQAYTHEDHGTIAPFRNDASEFHFWLHQMTEQGMAIATDIEANKPYIISMPNNITYPATYNQAGKVTFSAKDVVVPVSTPVMIHLSDGSIGVGGVYNSLPKMEGFYALNVGDDFDGYPEGSVFVNNYRTIRPFEVYSYHASRSAGTRTISVSSLFGGVDGATGILDVMDKQESDEIKVYSINGILLKKGNRSEVMNSLPKGLYIIGNQKIMVK